MGNQFQRLTTPRGWDPEAVHVTRYGTWKLTMSFPWPDCSCLERIPEASLTMDPITCVAVAKTDPDRQHPLCPQCSPSGTPLPCSGFGTCPSRDLTLTLTLPRTGTLHRNLSMLRNLTLHLSRLVTWTLSSALQEDHETRVVSSLATSLDQILTLRLSSRGDPIPTSDNTTRLGYKSGAGCLGMEPGSSPCFPGRVAAPREDSGGLHDQGPIDMCDLGSQRRILTVTVSCALNSPLRGDHCPAVGSGPGASWDLTLTLTLLQTGPLHQNISLPRNLTPHLSRLVTWTLTTALKGDCETGVTSALETSLDRTHTPSKALAPGEPIPTSDNTTRLVSRSGAC